MGNIPSQPPPFPDFHTNLATPSTVTAAAVEASDTITGSLTTATSASYSEATTLTIPGTLTVDATTVVSLLTVAEVPESTAEATDTNSAFLLGPPPLPSSTNKGVIIQPDATTTTTSLTSDDVSTKTESLNSTTLSTSTTPSTSTSASTRTTFMPTTHEPDPFTCTASFTFRRCVHSDSPEEGTSDGCVLVVAPLTSVGDDGGVSTVSATPVSTSLSLPTSDTTSSNLSGASTPPPSSATLENAGAPLSTQPEKHASWSAAKVVAPTVIVSVAIAALVLWWLIRRERKKNIERERQIEEKAQFFSKSYCDGLRERMMAVDESKTGVLGGGYGDRDVMESGWVGGTGSDSANARDRAGQEAKAESKERTSSLSVIEQDLANARNGVAEDAVGSPVSSATKSQASSHDGKGVSEYSGDLTALPTGIWKVFRGSREIQPYQPAQRMEGGGKRGSALGKVMRRVMR